MKPSERLAKNSSNVMAILEQCATLFDELAEEIEALKRDRQYTGHRTAPIDDPSDPVHPESKMRTYERTSRDMVECPWGKWVKRSEAEAAVEAARHPYGQPKHPDRLEAWALTTLDGDTQGVWFERESAEPIPGEELQHRLVELRDGERIVGPSYSLLADGTVQELAPPDDPGDYVLGFMRPDDVVLTAEQAARVGAVVSAATEFVAMCRDHELASDDDELESSVGAIETDDLRALGIEVDSAT